MQSKAALILVIGLLLLGSMSFFTVSETERALKLQLAYDEHGEPPALLPEQPERDPRWVELASIGFADTLWSAYVAPGP